MAVQTRGRAPAAGQRPSPTQTAKQSPAIPFVRAARKKTLLSFDTGALQLGAAQVQPGPIEIPAAGFLRFIDLEITLTTAGNAAAVTFAPDGPFNAITFVTLTNSAGDTILVPFTGYQLYLINKYGLLSEDPPFADPRRDVQFSATTGAVGTGGSAHWFLRLPLELDPRDAFCAVPNLAANKSYNIQFMFSASASIYGVAPTAAPTIRVTGVSSFWSQPAPQNAVGTPQQVAPIGNGSVSMWRLQTVPVTQGDKIFQLTNVGNVIRLILFTLRTAAGARTSADWPAISQLLLNNDVLFYMPLNNWQSDMATAYGYNTGAIDQAGGIDTGVYAVYQFVDQRGKALCDGPRDQYLPTLDATLLQLRGTSFGAAASTLEVITNEIKPSSAAALYSPNIS